MTMPFECSFSQVSAPDAVPRQWVLIAHGIFGRGVNLRGVARSLVSARPDWGAILVDLRMHGSSQGANSPHSVQSTADDLVSLCDALASQGVPVRAIAGHSFGGKVAALASDALQQVRQLWVLDSDPGRDDGAMERTPPPFAVTALQAMESLPARFDSRAQFVSALATRQVSTDVARWLAMNLVAAGDGYTNSLQLPALRELLASFYRTDVWPEIERLTSSIDVHLVVAGGSTAVLASSRQRMGGLAGANVHVFEDARHWIHIDRPVALTQLLATSLPE
jgi:esterase